MFGMLMFVGAMVRWGVLVALPLLLGSVSVFVRMFMSMGVLVLMLVPVFVCFPSMIVFMLMVMLMLVCVLMLVWMFAFHFSLLSIRNDLALMNSDRKELASLPCSIFSMSLPV